MDGTNLPSKNGIVSITSDLLRLVFPGFFEDKLTHSSEIKMETALLMDSVAGKLEVIGDTDWFSFVAESGWVYRIAGSLESLTQARLTLYDTDAATRMRIDDGIGETSNRSRSTQVVIIFAFEETTPPYLSSSSSIADPVRVTTADEHCAERRSTKRMTFSCGDPARRTPVATF